MEIERLYECDLESPRKNETVIKTTGGTSHQSHLMVTAVGTA
jgi:hypothetical protein